MMEINKYLVSYKFVDNGHNGYGDCIFESQKITDDDIQDIKACTGKQKVSIVSIFKLDK